MPQEEIRSEETLKERNKKQIQLAAQLYSKFHPQEPFSMSDAMKFWTHGKDGNFSAAFDRLDRIIGFEKITVEDVIEYSE